MPTADLIAEVEYQAFTACCGAPLPYREVIHLGNDMRGQQD